MPTPEERSQWPLSVMLWCMRNKTNEYVDLTTEECKALIQVWLKLPQERRDAFRKSLFEEQQCSEDILRRWLSWPETQWPMIPDPLTPVSSFIHTIRTLLLRELSNFGLDGMKTLPEIRKDAAIQFACMRVARECYPYSQTNRTDPRPTALPTENDTSTYRFPSCPWLQFDPQAQHMPHYLWDIQRREAVVTADVHAQPVSYVAISHTWGRWRKKNKDGENTSVDCPGARWPVPENTRFDVQTLPDILDPLKSHTKYVWIDLLCIPQDESPLAVQEVARQGGIFRRATECICWLKEIDGWHGMTMAIKWMCAKYLDQQNDMSWPSQEYTRFLQLHFPRQDSVVLDSWTRLSESHFRPTDYNRAMDMITSRYLCELVDHALWLYLQKEPDASGSHHTNPWFDSLWTLQEVCLRSDMILCGEGFARLEVNSCAVTIADLCALLKETTDDKVVSWWQTPTSVLIDRLRPDFDPPPGYSEPGLRLPLTVELLAKMFRLMGLIDLFKLSRVGIIRLGNIRVCSDDHPDSRSQALMSAAGATEWFLPFSQQQAADQTSSLIKVAYPYNDTSEEEENTVVTRATYPGPFIEELRHKAGSGAFFGSATMDVGQIGKLLENPGLAGALKLPIGSLLPFGPGRSTDMSDLSLPAIDVDSVRSWEILKSGSVRIKRAFIQCSSMDDTLEPFVCTWFGPPIELPTTIRTFAPLMTNLFDPSYTDEPADLRRMFKVWDRVHYAVALSVDHYRVKGVLLASLGSLANRAMIRVGNYTVARTRGDESMVGQEVEVDWWVV